MRLGKRILVVEDDPETRRLFGEILAEDGFEVLGCSHDALPAADGFALVLTDLNFRGARYASAIASQWVRLLRERYHAPVVVVTGHAEATQDLALLLQAAAVIPKPIDLVELELRVRGFLEPQPA